MEVMPRQGDIRCAHSQSWVIEQMRLHGLWQLGGMQVATPPPHLPTEPLPCLCFVDGRGLHSLPERPRGTQQDSAYLRHPSPTPGTWLQTLSRGWETWFTGLLESLGHVDQGHAPSTTCLGCPSQIGHRAQGCLGLGWHGRWAGGRGRPGAGTTWRLAGCTPWRPCRLHVVP